MLQTLTEPTFSSGPDRFGGPVLNLVPLRPEDLPLALDLLHEAAEWAPLCTPNPDPSILTSPQAVWFTALNGQEAVGVCGLHSIPLFERKAEVAWGVVSKYRGNGAGRLLAQTLTDKAWELGLTRLECHVQAGAPSAQICKANGWEREGLHRGACVKGGKEIDTETYAIRRA